MEWWTALLLMLAMVCGLMALGLPVAFAFFVANIVGAAVFLGFPAGITSVVRNAMQSIASFTLAPIPLFLLIGEVLLRTGLAFKAVAAIDGLITRVPGRIAVVAVSGGTVFSALSGSTIATTAMLGNALLPQMLARRYHPTMAMGPIMAIGGVDMLIPPSALTVLLGSLAKIPVAELLVAGILPGLVMSALFILYIVLRCAFNPALAPAEEGAAAPLRAWQRWMPFFRDVVPLLLIFVVVVGGIFTGIASPTDSAALGVAMALVIAACAGALTWERLLGCLREVAKVTTMILFIIAASLTFSQILAFSGATDGALARLMDVAFSPLGALLFMVAVLLLLGCFVDQASMMLLTLPFFMPLATALKIDLIHLGVVFLIAMQIGLLTPPFGLLLFVMKGVAPPDIEMREIYLAAAPFALITLAVLALVVFYAPIATWLPGVFM
ncbi:MAG TPA: TRAP transporter large permease subunit [Burkholderiales bacterium]|nr:TRAP transporter large permease subunit [Burkholderiales bacterium]